MATLCILQPLLVAHPLSSAPFLKPRCKHFRHISFGLPPARCQEANKTSPSNVETTRSGASPGNESALTDSKRAAIEVGRGSSLVAFYSDHYTLPLCVGNDSPIDKYRAVRLLLEGDTSLMNFLDTRPSPMSSCEELCLVHEERYIQKLLSGDLSDKEQRNLGFSWSPELVKRSCASIGGTVAAMHIVMLGLRRAAANITGGKHPMLSGHGKEFYIFPSGLFNDIAVAASIAVQAYPKSCNLERPVLIIDLDVHQGNVTEKIFEEDDRVITFSMYGENNKSQHSKMKSNYNVDLLDSTGDEYYLAVLFDWLQQLFNSHNPSLVFFQAGVDALREDSSCRLSLTRQGLIHRNNMVYTACLTRKVPLVITMGSGFSKPLEACIEAYADVYRSAALRFGSNHTHFHHS